jgi:hypothetical protein
MEKLLFQMAKKVWKYGILLTKYSLLLEVVKTIEEINKKN